MRRTGSSLLNVFILSVVVYLLSCNKTNSYSQSQPLPPASGVPVSVTLDPAHPSYLLPSDYLGLSFEMTAITDSNYFSPNSAVFIQLIKNLSPGVFRIGANGVDKTYWSGGPRFPSTLSDSITTTDVNRFSSFIHAIQWKTIFGLNCGGDYSPSTAAAEAYYTSNDLGSLLESFEVGNEADLYPRNGYRNTGYTVMDFNNQWEAYYHAVEAVKPGLKFSGPAFAYNRTWLSAFAKPESGNINELTIHYYQAGPGTDPSINLNTLLSAKADSNIDVFGKAIESIASSVQLPYRVSECNSIYGGGKTNVSNTFGASLWAIDYMWRLAYTGCTGINFHGGGNGPYSPIGYTNGSFFPKPEYYSMLFFRNGAKGNLLPCTVNAGKENVTAYASKSSDGTIYVTIINKETEDNVAVSLMCGSAVQSVSLSSLTAASLNATDGIVLQGYSLQTDGTIRTSPLKKYAVNEPGFNINVAASSAILVVISP